jgi:F-type H+-transporting ATPase subunit gamma
MAANTRDIRRRIKSVKNTAQITKAMQMVAASKMRRAQQAAMAGRAYAELMNRVLASLKADEDESASHPLLDARPVKRELAIVVSTDKGLCGALNSNLFREISAFPAETTDFVTCGRKGVQFLARSKRQLLADFPLRDAPTNFDTKVVSKFAIEKYLAGEVDKVSVVYTDFINTLTQQPRVSQILPIVALKAELAVGEAEEQGEAREYLFEPDPRQVLEAILPHYIHFQLYQMVLDARASEHSARMVAMKNATDNAKQIIKDLTLEYNKIRQASITTEILEIATAQMALGK